MPQRDPSPGSSPTLAFSLPCVLCRAVTFETAASGVRPAGCAALGRSLSLPSRSSPSPCCKKIDSLKSPLNRRPEPRMRLLSGHAAVLPLSLSLQHGRLAAPAAPAAHAQLRDRGATLAALGAASAAGRARPHQQLSALRPTARPGPPPRPPGQRGSPSGAAHPGALLTLATSAEKPERPQEGVWPHPTAPATTSRAPDPSRAVQTGSVRRLELYRTRVTSSFL